MDFLNDVADWIKSLFSSDKKDEPPKRYVPSYPKEPYDIRSRPDLNKIPEELVRFIAAWFVSAGMSIEGAAATIGNLWCESYLNPAQLQIPATKPIGPGRGLAQWTDSSLTKTKEDDGDQRWDRYEKVFFPNIKKSHAFWKSHDLLDIEPQLAYIIHEMKNHYKSVWREVTSTGSVSQKSTIVLKRYEIAKKRENKEEQNLRANISEKIYNLIKNDKRLKSIIASRKGS